MTWSLIALVFVPTVISFLYLWLLAPDEYVSEARFAVRSATEMQQSAINDALSVISSFAGSRSTTQDGFIVTDYIRSRTIIDDLGGKDVLYGIYARDEADWLSRLGRPLPLEKIWKYWKKKVTAVIDTPSSVITLEVRAFTPDDAHRLAQMIVHRSEQLVNEISERSRRDATMRAEAEVNAARDGLSEARAALLIFRNENNLIDPLANAKGIGVLVGQLTQEKVKIENDLATIDKSVASDSPIQRLLKARLTNINKQIDQYREDLAGRTQNQTVSKQLALYEDLQLRSQFAEKLYGFALAGFEKARMEQEKQQLYLVTIVRPSLPERATYPQVVVDTVLIAAALVIGWSMLALVIAAVRDHTG